MLERDQVSTLLPTALRYVRAGVGVLAFRRGDFLLAGYHRSGTTWIRLVLCNIISLCELGGRDVDPILNDVMPELGANNLLKRHPYRSLPRVIKTHRPYTPLFGRVPAIGVIRDPRDVMVSRYHRRRDWWRDFDGSFSEFLRHPRFGLEGWFRHYSSWRNRWLVEIRYEELLQDPLDRFKVVVDVLGARIPETILEEAIARSRFDRVQRMERAKKPGARGGELHFRAGTCGEWIEYFDAADVDLFLSLATKYNVSVYR